MSKTTKTQPTAAQKAAAAAMMIAAGLDPAEYGLTAPKAAAEPKADVEVKYRSAKAISSGKAEADAIYARYRKETGRAFKAMTPAKQKACRAEVKAVWAARPGTRKTKVA